MEYIQLNITVRDADQAELLVALLAAAGFEGFEEQPGALIATIPQDVYHAEEAVSIVGQAGATCTVQTVAQQNWNAIWEADFQPVVVRDFCTVRASFHPPATDTPYEVIITPKMSFGTGHHATTQLMIESMKEVDFRGKEVLDFGTGTGILAILARKLGADRTLAIDNDEWAVENTYDNAGMNGCVLEVSQGSLEDVPPGQYDIILANINRNILLAYMADMASRLRPGGVLLLSGILTEDQEAITVAAAAGNLSPDGEKSLNGWLCLHFGRA